MEKYKNKTIDVSIIIVNYKSWKVLEKCISSIQSNLKNLSYEVIVVDNCSDDGMFEKFQSIYSWVNLIQNKGNYGYSSASNLGASNAIGNFYVFLNPDTEITKSPAINKMVKLAREDSQQGIVSCRKIKPGNRLEREITFLSPWLTIGVVRSMYKIIYQKKLQTLFNESEMIWNPEWLTGSIFLISSENFELIGGLPEKDYWMYFEEMDVAQRMKLIGKKITLLRDVEILHQHGGSSRINPRTSAITKSEVMISRFVYIQKFFGNSSKRYLMYFFFILISLIDQLIKAIISIPFFWLNRPKASILLLIESLKYFFNAFFRKSWRSKRLEQKI